MEMSTESIHHRWYESPRVNTTTSPVGQSSSGLGSGQLDGTSGVQGSSNGSSDLNPAVAEHMGAFFLDPSSSHHQRAAAARYYHQSMHSPYAAAASHGKFHPQIIFLIVNFMAKKQTNDNRKLFKNKLKNWKKNSRRSKFQNFSAFLNVKSLRVC